MKKLSLLVALTIFAVVLLAGAASAAPVGLWDASAPPPVGFDAAGNPASGGLTCADYFNTELGVKFEADRNIAVVGVRFWRNDSAERTWTGSLWNADGTLLRTGPDGTSGTGWQEVFFAEPKLMVPGDRFIASYYHDGYTSRVGEAWTWYYFTPSGWTFGPVTALKSLDAEGNGVYIKGASVFPNLTYRDLNYWVTPLWIAYDTSGFYRPVDMGGVYNRVKGGQTVPLKFELFDAATGEEITDIAAIADFSVGGIACPDGGDPVDAIEFTTTGGTELRYDSVAGHFIQNWKTPRNPGACYRVTLRLIDGSSISANFQLK
jgi:hypothetical protein